MLNLSPKRCRAALVTALEKRGYFIVSPRTDSFASEKKSQRHRLWRYGPLVLWAAVIFIASTGLMSASNTNPILRPVLLWLFPHVSDATIHFISSVVIRKGAHLTEYAILGLFAARAFSTSSHHPLRSRWFLVSLLLVVAYSLGDEFHQSFVHSRTPSIYDSLIDSCGGLIGLTLVALCRRRRATLASGSTR